MGLWWLLAALAFLATGILYFHGRLLLAALGGVAFWALAARVVWLGMSPGAAAAVLALLCVGPAVFLLVHAVDARKGIFLLPTVYSIPIAFVCGLALLVAAGVGVIL